MSNPESVGVKIEQFRKQERHLSAAFKAILCLGILAISFFVTLQIIDNLGGSTDLRRDELEHALQNAAPTAKGYLVYSPSSEANEVQTPALAFDGSLAPASFWETKNFPVDLIIILPQLRTLSGYSISAGELVGRMPRSWDLEGTAEGQKWLTLDQQEEVHAWHAGDTRNYGFKKPETVRALRFHFREGFDQTIFRLYEISFRESAASKR